VLGVRLHLLGILQCLINDHLLAPVLLKPHVGTNYTMLYVSFSYFMLQVKRIGFFALYH
jgi:hypothetical protein